MAAAFALAIFSGKIIFIFANLENLRIFQICFFTEKVVTINGICLRWLPAGAFAQQKRCKLVGMALRWLLATSPNYSAEIVRTADG